MRERKYVKFRVDMYEDTKFKIIDMKPERDVIHYVWNRIVLLAGKVNLEGDLYLSKNIPYTIETLAIEFNRDIAKIKLALEVFIKLEMIEFIEDKVYRVKNFAKHQNIKAKEKEISKNKDDYPKDIHVSSDKNLITNKINEYKDEKFGGNSVENIEDYAGRNLETTDKDIIKTDDNTDNENGCDDLQNGVPMVLETKKIRRKNRKKKDQIIDMNITDGEIKEDSICCFTDRARPLEDGESTVLELSFG